MTTPERTETGGPNRTPRSEVTAAVAQGREKEPGLLIDLSGSMDWEAGPPEGSSPSRRQIVIEALPVLIAKLEGEDSQAATEQAGGSDEEGGVMAHGFSDTYVEIGDLNSSNAARKLKALPWGGATHIYPAWQKLLEDFMEEFGDRSYETRPVLETIIVTDGEANDWDLMLPVLEGADQGHVFIVAILGHGDAHDKTVRAYQQAAERQRANNKFSKSYVHIVSFDAVTNPTEIAEDLITMAV